MTNCPSQTILRLIGHEMVGEVTFADVEAHVEHCQECQSLLEAATVAFQAPRREERLRWALPNLPGLEIERELGRGATSVVYLAWEPALARHVAVKLIPRNSQLDPHAREHWLAEARALSRVPHDHVVAIHRVEETEDWLCLVVEFVSGGTLKARLGEPLPPRDAARLAETIARAVGYFHTRGLCHLDLKPSNILLEGGPDLPWEKIAPRITDFGIARLEDEPGVTETGANGPKGTPSYMAPEQVAALPGTIGPAADIHALGALLYHMLTGRPPYQGASSAQTLDQVRGQDPAPPRRINGQIPRDLETICLTCLEKSPSRRYKSAEALAYDLRLWLDGRPIVARRLSPFGHAWRSCRRRPAVAGLLFALALSLATGVIGLVVLLDRAEVERARLAEARRHAEAYEEFSASTVAELAGFLRSSLRRSQSLTPGQLTESLLKLRESTEALKGRGVVPSATLGVLEMEIGWALLTSSNPEAARSLLEGAVVDLRPSVSKCIDTDEVRRSLGGALLWSGELAEEAGQLGIALERYEEAASAYVRLDVIPEKFVALTVIHKKLLVLADRLGREGLNLQEDRSRRLSKKVVADLIGPDAAIPGDGPRSDVDTLGLLLRHVALEQSSVHEDKYTRHAYELIVAHWLSLAAEPLSPFRLASNAEAFDRDPDAGAMALISSVRANCAKLGLEPSLVPAAVFIFKDQAHAAAAKRRSLGQKTEARSITARFLTLARCLVREYPESTHSHRMLSDAYDQIKKNASNDRNLVVQREALVHAVDAAQRALALDPERFQTRRHLEKMTKQLASVRAELDARGVLNASATAVDGFEPPR